MSCIFCDIVKGKIGSEVNYEDDDFIVVKDINPRAPVHLLIVTKKHIVQPVDPQHRSPNKDLLGEVFYLARKIARKENFLESGYRLTNNNGRDAGQVIEHFHVHLLAGRRLGPEG